jgi:hypothetical protein
MTFRKLFTLISLTLSVAAYSQLNQTGKLDVVDYSKPKEYEIAEVTISGVEFIQKEVLVSLSRFKNWY